MLFAKRLFPVVLLVFSQSFFCWADSFVSIKDGDWFDSQVWDRNEIPGINDTVLINKDIIISENISVGVSAGSGEISAVKVEFPGSLKLVKDRQLRILGDIILSNAPLTLQSGSHLFFDSSLSASPSTTAYRIQISTAHNQEFSRLNIIGSASSRSLVSSNRSNNAAHGYITDAGFLQGGLITASYTDFDSIGDRLNPAIQAAPTGNSFFSLSNVSFRNGGMLRTSYNIGEDAIFSLRSSSWTNTLTGSSVFINSYNRLLSGLREIINCVFDKEALYYPPTGLIISGNIFLQGFDVADGPWLEFSKNLIRHEGIERRIANSISGNYWLIDSISKVNPHFLQAGTYARDIVIDGEIFDFRGEDGNGDCILIGEPVSPVLITILNCLVLPNSGDDSSGTLFSALGNRNTSIIAEHNTLHSGSQGVAVGETFPGFSSMLLSFKSNLVWDSIGGRGFKLFDSGNNDYIKDLVSAVNADYNLGFMLLEGSNNRGYNNLEFSPNFSPGNHDIEVDPLFTDSKRNISTWDLDLGGPGNVAHALSEMSKVNDANGFNPAYSIESLYRYVREGFEPRNLLLKGAGHDGRDLGAVELMRSQTLTPTATPSPTATQAFYFTPTKTPTAAPSLTATPTAIPSVQVTVTPTIPTTPKPTAAVAPTKTKRPNPTKK